MGVNANTLQHKFNPNADSHRLTLDDAEQATVFSQDPEIAQALASACGHVCIPVKIPPGLACRELADKVAIVAKDFGEVMQATLEAIADGSVTIRELATYDAKFHALLAASVALRAELVLRVPTPPLKAVA